MKGATQGEEARTAVSTPMFSQTTATRREPNQKASIPEICSLLLRTLTLFVDKHGLGKVYGELILWLRTEYMWFAKNC